MKKIITVILDVMILVLLFSCVSKPKFRGESDLCGLIVDENNAPVSDFIIRCTKAPSIYKSAITNENGVFVIQGVPSGDYKISGEKENYTRLTDMEYCFNDRSKIICIQVMSLEGAIETIDELILRNEAQGARTLLKSILCRNKSPEQALVSAYKFLITDDIKKQKKIAADIRKTKDFNSEYFSNYADLLESISEEVKNEK